MIGLRNKPVSTLDGRGLEFSAFGEKQKVDAGDRAFLTRSSEVFSSALGTLGDIVGRKFPMPRLGILSAQREGNFGVVDFSSGKAVILLNPSERISVGEAGHELTHYMRFAVHGRVHKGTRMIVEEACAILVEASLPYVDRKGSQINEILGFLSDSRKSPDPFTAAEWVVGRFASEMRMKAFAPSFAEAENTSIGRYVIEKSLKKAESKVDVSQWEDHRYAPVRHKVGAGISLLIFMMNEFDLGKSIRYAIRRDVSDILGDVSSMIREQESSVIGNIRKLGGRG